MVLNDPHEPQIGDIVKPRYNKDKFIETYIKFMRLNQNASLIAFEIYSSLISKNYIFQSFTYDDDDDLCDCFSYYETTGWAIPIQCLKRVKV